MASVRASAPVSIGQRQGRAARARVEIGISRGWGFAARVPMQVNALFCPPHTSTTASRACVVANPRGRAVARAPRHLVRSSSSRALRSTGPTVCSRYALLEPCACSTRHALTRGQTRAPRARGRLAPRLRRTSTGAPGILFRRYFRAAGGHVAALREDRREEGSSQSKRGQAEGQGGQPSARQACLPRGRRSGRQRVNARGGRRHGRLGARGHNRVRCVPKERARREGRRC